MGWTDKWRDRQHPRGIINDRYMWCNKGRECHKDSLHIVYRPGKEPPPATPNEDFPDHGQG